MRYVYYELNPQHECTSFRQNVALMTYGDDNVGNVSDKIKTWFNHTTVQKALADIGVTYTMADKESISIPLINIKDVTFLKRSWRFDSDVGGYLCPLEHESIEKSLMVWVRSKSVSEQEQSIDIIHSALREYFFYGKNIFEEKKALFVIMLKAIDMQEWLVEKPFPTWPELYNQWHTASIRLYSV